MGYFFDGGFTGFLYSMKETGRKLANGAKELVEDFISGFNGHGWKLWKRNGSWRLEIDEIFVRKSLTAYEQIISQITSIKGSQGITQGHAKIKKVEIGESDVYNETVSLKSKENFLSSKWRSGVIGGINSTLEINQASFSVKNSNFTQYLYVYANNSVESLEIEVSNFKGKEIIYSYFNEDGIRGVLTIKGNGIYLLPKSVGIPNMSTENVGFLIYSGTSFHLKDINATIETREDISKKRCFILEIEDESNSIVEYDFIRCQRDSKFYHVQVGSVYQYYINIPITEFETDEYGEFINPPTPGDEIVQFGNASHNDKYKNRHSAIYLHLEENEPIIDLMADIYTKDWGEGDLIKVRLGGNIPYTDGDRGLYCVNGKLLFVDSYGDVISALNPDGSASFARGNISWTADGYPYFKGQITSGDENGKHIEINPIEASINIYDESNIQVNTFEGNSYGNIDDLFDINLPSITPITSTKLLENITSSTEVVENYEEITATEEKYIYLDGSILIEHEGFTYTSDIYKGTDGKGSCSNSCKLVIRKYNIETGEILGEEVLKNNSTTDSGSTTSIILSFKTTIAEEGFYRLIYILESSVKSNDGTRNTSNVTLSPKSFKLVRQQYISRFFANGLCLGISSENYFSLIKKNSSYWGDYMSLDYNTTNCGLRADTQRMYLKSNPRGFKKPIFAFPMKVAFKGVIHISPNGNISNGSDMSFDYSSISLSWSYIENSYRLLELLYPTEWKQYNFSTSGTLIINIIEYGAQKPNDAYVYNLSDDRASIKIYTTNNILSDFMISYHYLLD